MLSIDEVKFGVVFDEVPVQTSGRNIAVNIDGVDARHVNDADDTQVEHEVHLCAAEPDQVRDVGDRLVVVPRLGASYRRRAVEDGARQSPERVVQLPDVAWEQRRRRIDDHTRRIDVGAHVVGNRRTRQPLRSEQTVRQHAPYCPVS